MNEMRRLCLFPKISACLSLFKFENEKFSSYKK